MQTPSSTDAEKAECTERILKTWKISSLDDVVGSSLSPSLWSLSLLKRLDLLCTHSLSHTDVRGLLRNEITHRVGNTPSNGFLHRPFLSAMDVDNVLKTQGGRDTDSCKPERRMLPALTPTLPPARTPSPKLTSCHQSQADTSPSPGIADHRPVRYPAPVTPKSVSTASFPRGSGRLGLSTPACSPSNETTAADGFKRKRDAMMACLHEELESQRKRVRLEVDIASATVKKTRFEQQMAERHEQEAARTLASLPAESEKLTELEGFRAFQNDIFKIRKKYAALLGNSKGAPSTVIAPDAHRQVVQESCRTIFELLNHRVEAEAVAMETEAAKAKKAQRVAQEEMDHHRVVVNAKKAELEAAEKAYADLLAENEAFDAFKTSL
ncbi:hypothetical protein GCG54_00015664 [Colletotrichum gloeosporioides]|uniref:Uncharacterized protein n=1 Tax=Colletotrichum gloeosporioides TaxID=474922 RepID=A0A8H8WNA4_COLGL|nr:uncharacterized protein GCG54_00015664 [Colletotrichum gloeosporioides]KAF3797020.1 hypothetical protein GCG54_00015664 [Colletotrichum gloeosporioides]